MIVEISNDINSLPDVSNDLPKEFEEEPIDIVPIGLEYHKNHSIYLESHRD